MADDIVAQLEHFVTNETRMPAGLIVSVISELERLRSDKAELVEAIRLTNEYSLLPAIDGWSWWDAYRKHAHPDHVAEMKRYCDQAMEARHG